MNFQSFAHKKEPDEYWKKAAALKADFSEIWKYWKKAAASKAFFLKSGNFLEFTNKIQTHLFLQAKIRIFACKNQKTGILQA